MRTLINNPGKRTSIVSFGIKEVGPYYWVGNSKNGIEYYAGQTFTAPAQGILRSIKLYTSLVKGSTKVILSVYKFDSKTLTWKQKQAEASKEVDENMESKWVEFEFPAFEVHKNQHYAFKVACNGSGMLAIAECPWNVTNPYPDGIEWVGSSTLLEGNFQKDFDLAFEGEIEASFDAQFI